MPRARWSDEDATVVSCRFNVVGNLVFIVGSVCFFPSVVDYGGEGGTFYTVSCVSLLRQLGAELK